MIGRLLFVKRSTYSVAIQAVEQDEAEFAKAVEHDRERKQQADAQEKKKLERERKVMNNLRWIRADMSR